MRQLLAGIKWGLIVAAVLCAWVLILVPFNGSWVFRSKSGAEYDAGWIMLCYLVGGISTGALFGGLAVLLRHKIGAFFLGAFAMLPLGFAILITESHFASWTRTETLTLAMLALLLGGPGGVIIREFASESANREKFDGEDRGR